MLIGTMPNNPFKPVSTVPRVAASNSLCALSWGDVEAYCYWKHVVMATMNNMSQGRMARKQMMKWSPRWRARDRLPASRAARV